MGFCRHVRVCHCVGQRLRLDRRFALAWTVGRRPPNKPVKQTSAVSPTTAYWQTLARDTPRMGTSHERGIQTSTNKWISRKCPP
ncbi:MAG: hypothetical protein ACE5HS_13020 [bacterium]